MHARKSFVIAIFSVLFCTGHIIAEPNSTKGGKLPDGTAFRVDAEGNQIVDYIAELESTVDQLNRRVGGFQDELQIKQGQIEKLQAQLTGSSPTSISEKSIVSANTKNHISSKSDCPPVECDNSNAIKKTTSSSNSLNASSGKGSSAPQTVQISDLETNLQNELTKRDGIIADQGGIIERQDALIADKSKLIEELQSVNDDRGQKIVTLQAQLKDAQAELISVRSELNVVTSQAAKARLVDMPGEGSNSTKNSMDKTLVASIPVGSEFSTENRHDSSQNVASSVNSAAALQVARTRAIKATKGQLNSNLVELRKLIKRRAMLSSAYQKRSGTKVRFTLANPISSRGYTINMISDRMRSVERVAELARMRVDLEEIASKVLEDIALLERMMKV